jgi:hypothetical protein
MWIHQENLAVCYSLGALNHCFIITQYAKSSLKYLCFILLNAVGQIKGETIYYILNPDFCIQLTRQYGPYVNLTICVHETIDNIWFLGLAI